jgi:MFS family permease
LARACPSPTWDVSKLAGHSTCYENRLTDVTIVNVALPTIRRRLHAGPSELEWVVAGYALAFAATLVLWGRVGDVFGRRRVFLVAVAAFGLASLGAGLSQTPLS